MKFPALSGGPHVWWFGSCCVISAIPVSSVYKDSWGENASKSQAVATGVVQTCTPCSLSVAPGTRGKTLSGIKWQCSLSRYSLFQCLTLILPGALCPILSPYATCPLETATESLLCDVPASAKPVGARPQDQLHAKLMRLPSFSSVSYYVGMCGDGANDCGVRRSSFPILVKFPLFQPKEFCDERLPNTTCHQHFPS